jgi:hypothetical protein
MVFGDMPSACTVACTHISRALCRFLCDLQTADSSFGYPKQKDIPRKSREWRIHRERNSPIPMFTGNGMKS